jgi:hypothetical protein
MKLLGGGRRICGGDSVQYTYEPSVYSFFHGRSQGGKVVYPFVGEQTDRSSLKKRFV